MASALSALSPISQSPAPRWDEAQEESKQLTPLTSRVSARRAPPFAPHIPAVSVLASPITGVGSKMSIRVRVTTSPAGLGDLPIRGLSKQPVVTYRLVTGENALDAVARTRVLWTVGRDEKVTVQAKTSGDQAIGADAVPVAALIAEAVRRSDIVTARGLLPALVDDEPMRLHWLRVLERPRPVRVRDTDRDFSTEYRALLELKARYRRTWAAIVGEGVVASGDTLAELRTILRQRPPGSPRPLVYYFE